MSNFAYIARNITFIDEVVTARKFPIVTNRRLHYAVVGAVDASAYIASGKLRADQLAESIISAEEGSISIGLTWEMAGGRDHGILSGNDIDEFVCFVMQWKP